MARIDFQAREVRYHQAADSAEITDMDLDPAALAEVEEAFIGAGLL